MYELYNTDKNLETKGIWYRPTDDFQVLLARAGGSNQKYSALVEKLIKPHRRALRGDKADSRVITKLLKEAFSKTVILGWQIRNDDGNFVDGISDPDDSLNVLPVNWENVFKILDKFDDLYLDIKDMSESSSAYLKEEIKEDSKNS